MIGERRPNVWRVMRFEMADGKYIEAASNEVGPEQVPVPDGYRFVSSRQMVPVDALLGGDAIERVLAETRRQYPLLVNEFWARRILHAALGDEEIEDV